MTRVVESFPYNGGNCFGDNVKFLDGHQWSPPTTCVDPLWVPRTRFLQECVIWAEDDTDDDNIDSFYFQH